MLRVLVFALIVVAVPSGMPQADEPTRTQDELTAPRRIPATREEQSRISRCYQFSARAGGYEGRVMVEATIGVDGRVSRFETAPGIPDWQLQTAECVMAVLRFDPGKRNGVPVEAVAAIPVVFKLGNSGNIELPNVVSTPDEIEAMYRLCYPADQLAIVELHYRVLMTRSGNARKIELVESSGVPALDQAGVCMLEKLKFLPARRAGTAIETTVVMPIRLRPPR